MAISFSVPSTREELIWATPTTEFPSPSALRSYAMLPPLCQWTHKRRHQRQRVFALHMDALELVFGPRDASAAWVDDERQRDKQALSDGLG